MLFLQWSVQVPQSSITSKEKVALLFHYNTSCKIILSYKTIKIDVNLNSWIWAHTFELQLVLFSLYCITCNL